MVHVSHWNQCASCSSGSSFEGKGGAVDEWHETCNEMHSKYCLKDALKMSQPAARLVDGRVIVVKSVVKHSP